jgi:Rieske 2Fe-2S family protein
MNSPSHKLEETLPGRHYLDEAQFALERERIFHREWFCVGRIEGLEKKGDYRLVNVLGESLIIVRDRELHALHNVCRHRGAELIPSPGVDEQHGKFAAGIRCPYHSWNYNLDGALHSTPYLKLDKSCLGLHRAELDTWGGQIFVRLQPGEQTLAQMLLRAARQLQRYPLADLVCGHRIDYAIAANWKVILENYNECYHCAGVHPELCQVVPAFRIGGGKDLDWEHGIVQREGTNTFSFSGTTTRQAFPGLSENEKTRHFGELIYPNLLLSLSMDHVASFTLWPRSPGQTDVTCEFLFHPDEVKRPGFDAADAVEFWDLVNRQDWAICESVQRGMQSQKFSSGFYGPMEDWSLDIRNYVRERLAEN